MEAIQEIGNRPFGTEILYCEGSPKELFAALNDHYPVRYVINPAKRNYAPGGLDAELCEAKKRRIGNRVQKLLIAYRCEEG